MLHLVYLLQNLNTTRNLNKIASNANDNNASYGDNYEVFHVQYVLSKTYINY